jgi:hypothetical protein
VFLIHIVFAEVLLEEVRPGKTRRESQSGKACETKHNGAVFVCCDTSSASRQRLSSSLLYKSSSLSRQRKMPMHWDLPHN